MDTRILVGTEGGLWQLRGDALEPVDQFTASTVTALARNEHETWAIVDGRALWRSDSHQPDAIRRWIERASLDDYEPTCLAPTPDGLLIGTAEAPTITQWASVLLDACEALAVAAGMPNLLAGANMARHEAYRHLVARGFRTEILGVTMHGQNDPGYCRPGAYIIDDWR